MNWHQDLTINDATLYAGANGERWLGSFSSHEAAIEAVSIKREGKQVFSHKETSCCSEEDLELLAAIDFDER